VNGMGLDDCWAVSCSLCRIRKILETQLDPQNSEIRCAADPKRSRSAYWKYTVNEMGMEDCIAQVDHIHTVKCQELHVSAGPTPQGISRPLPAAVDTLTAARA